MTRMIFQHRYKTREAAESALEHSVKFGDIIPDRDKPSIESYRYRGSERFMIKVDSRFGGKTNA